MNLDKRRLLFQKIVNANIGQPCQTCIEYNEMERKLLDGEENRESARLFQKYFGTSIINSQSTVAFKLVPIERGIAKRGEEFFYMAQNLVPSCCDSCKERYQKMWEYHPERQKFIDMLVAFQAGNAGKKKVSIVGGRIK